ncbi:DUF1707 SHOCT-like domain-containing protein [Micromonospora purpureochromogenes]|uniref:DUF1707 domain-containing protein n=1 Tax=Micromonospora purpureochromogenes TaxID=47872 RepID=A0ABX2RD61_9ACTN|nr:DUF1707 domain-containing protein [Micromonospora purpureochromogenes]NYF54440.1 hypothetical protein [Micromonospora purpureochromogenes]
MTGVEDHESDPTRPELRIGTPERQVAEAALEVHLSEKRLDPDEFDQRIAACAQASNRGELLRLFADLPAPHPELPSPTGAQTEIDDDIPPVAVAGCLALGLGLPVAVVLGWVYGTWWALAVPVTATVAMTYVDHLRRPPREATPSGGPGPAHGGRSAADGPDPTSSASS